MNTITRAKTLEEFFHYNEIEPNDTSIYMTALTHSSKNFKNSKLENYERLEFLGDAIIQFLTSAYIFKRYHFLTQGQATNLRAKAVCTETFSNISQAIGLPRLIKTSNGQAESDAKSSPKVQADIFESITGAIYLDLGLNKAKDFVAKYVFSIIDDIHAKNNKDVKTQLQEHFQTFSREHIKYITELLPNKMFFSKVMHDKQIFGTGQGLSKKEAEFNAATDALKKLKTIGEDNEIS